MRGLIALNFVAGAIAVVLAGILWVANALEVSSTVILTYVVGLGLLLVPGGLHIYRRLTMNRAYAVATPRTVSNNYLRRRRRNAKQRSNPFLEMLGVNKGVKTYRPEVVSEVESCDPPDYRRAGVKRWDCIRCSLTVIADRKPTTSTGSNLVWEIDSGS